jgi:hypothetical protein
LESLIPETSIPELSILETGAGRKHGVNAAMRPRHWLIFGVVQFVGAAGGLGGLSLLQDPIGWGLSLLVLLPGTLVAWPFSKLGHVGTGWPFWTVYAIAVPVNVALFAVASFLVGLCRKSR